jgi:hypothetical protein
VPKSERLAKTREHRKVGVERGALDTANPERGEAGTRLFRLAIRAPKERLACSRRLSGGAPESVVLQGLPDGPCRNRTCKLGIKSPSL